MARRGPQRHLVVLAKAPRLGAVKSRLARGIGPLAAWRFYRRTLGDVLRRLAGTRNSSRRWQVWLAITPDGFAANSRFWPAGVNLVGQGPGDLGARMARPMQELPPGPVVVVGADVPDISGPLIAQAFEALERSDVVVGPATDGGYWLIGLRRRPAPVTRLRPGLFRHVRWSGPQALADTLAGLDRRLEVSRIATLSDIDAAEDLAAWKKSKN